MNNEHSFGQRIGACICLVVLSFIAIAVVSLVQALLSMVVDWTGTLPTFIAAALFYAYYPVLIMTMLGTIFGMIGWACGCSEKICPTRRGLRYKVLAVYFIIVFVINIVGVVAGMQPFRIIMLASPIEAYAFWMCTNGFKE